MGVFLACTIRSSGSLKVTFVARSLLEPDLSPSPSLPYSPRPHTYTSAAPDTQQYHALLVLTDICLPNPYS